MKLKAGLIFLLSVLLVCLVFTSCKKEDSGDGTEDGSGDEYSGSISPDGETGEGEGDGEGEQTPVDEGDPNATYEIFTADDLKTKLKMKGTYVLKADIDLGGAEWTPVGSAARPFAGTFDGAGFKISNFKITEKPTASEGDVSLAFKYAYGGFFGVTEKASVKNVTFDGVTVNVALHTDNTFMYVGAVAGYAKETSFDGITVSNVTLNAQSGEYITYVGGIAGAMIRSTAKNCTVCAEVTAKESLNDATAGGICAYSSESEFTYCTANGTVNATAKYGKAYSGGLVGYCSSSKIARSVSKAEITATVSSSSAQTGKKGSASAGGLAAIVTAPSFNKRTEITDSYTAGSCKVTAVGNKNSAYAGGFAASSEYGIYERCYSRADVKADSIGDAVYAAGLVAYLMNQADVKDATPYSYDTMVKGCFSIGNITVSSATTAYFIGTLTYSDLLIEGETFIYSSGYYERSKIYLNGQELERSSERVQKTGSEVASTVYGNMSILSGSYGYSTDVWEIISGESYPTLKPNA